MKRHFSIVILAALMFAACSSPTDGIINMRDLGDYYTSDGVAIRRGMLIRSALLADATDEELQGLAALPVTKVIDFRLEPEKQDRADRLPEGAKYIALPLDASGGAAEQTAEGEKPKTSGKKFDVRKIIVLVAFSEQAQQVAQQMYNTLFFSPECQAQYAQFFREVLTTDSGALLFHCTQGKDRTGVASALLLSALGADRQTVIADFDATNAVYAADVRKYSDRVRLFGGGDKEVAVVKALIGVNTDNFVMTLDSIDTKYGSVDNYLKGPIGLSDEDLTTLRNRYVSDEPTRAHIRDTRFSQDMQKAYELGKQLVENTQYN